MSDTDPTPLHATGTSHPSNPSPPTIRTTQTPTPPQQVVYIQCQDSFMGKVVVTVVLYFVMYLPGLIANLLF